MTARPLRLTTPVALALVAALAAGCAPTRTSGDSAGKFRGDQRLAAQTIEDLQSAASDSDQVKICRDLLTRAFATRLAGGGRSCAATVDEALKNTDSFDMTVESVRVTGDRATARVKFETGKTDRVSTFQLQREARRWRIAGF
jgi:hypothetical protein